MDVHPTKNGIYRYWPIPISELCHGHSETNSADGMSSWQWQWRHNDNMTRWRFRGHGSSLWLRSSPALPRSTDGILGFAVPFHWISQNQICKYHKYLHQISIDITCQWRPRMFSSVSDLHPWCSLLALTCLDFFLSENQNALENIRHIRSNLATSTWLL